MADFTRAAATAKRLVEANGRSVDLFKVNRTPADPTQPWRGVSGAPTVPEGGITATAIVSFVPATGSGMGKLVKDLTGSLVSAFDQVGLLASSSLPAGVNAEDFDSIRDGDDLWKIVQRGHLKPASTSVLYVLGLKR